MRDSKTALGSGFHAVDSLFQVLDSTTLQGNVDSGLQSPGFRIAKPRIPDSTSKIFLDSGFLIFPDSRFLYVEPPPQTFLEVHNIDDKFVRSEVTLRHCSCFVTLVTSKVKGT